MTWNNLFFHFLVIIGLPIIGEGGARKSGKRWGARLAMGLDFLRTVGLWLGQMPHKCDQLRGVRQSDRVKVEVTTQDVC